MNRLYAILLSCFLVNVFCFPQDDGDAYTRENPELEDADTDTVMENDYSTYPFLAIERNSISFNGADWSCLRDKFSSTGDNVVSIVHIGDSHVQAEVATAQTRGLLQRRYGSAGRGLVIPFRMAGTNQPADYSINGNNYTAARLLKLPWTTDMGFTGISIAPSSRVFELSVSTGSRSIPASEFDKIKIFSHGAGVDVRSVSCCGLDIKYRSYNNADTVYVEMDQALTNADLSLSSTGDCNVFGLELSNSSPGVAYHAIGNNGATYSAYNMIGSMGKDLRTFDPDLVIISLGANEAFGKITDETFYNNIHLLVSDIRMHNPDAKVLLVTPNECQRSVYTRRKGKRRRSRRVRSYHVNTNISRLRNVIIRYGQDNGIAVYDWYEVSGGAGSSAKWIASKLMSSDRIHNTWSGYRLQGSLFYDALVNAIEK